MAEDEDRSLFFDREKRESKPAGDREESPRSPTGTSTPAEALPAAGAAAPDLSEAAGTIAEAARAIAVQAQRIGTATEWVNDIKSVMEGGLRRTGKLTDGLEAGRQDLDRALAELKLLEEGLGKAMGALEALLEGLDRRSSELKAVKQDLAAYYGEWTAEVQAGRREMATLSQRLDAGDHMVTRLDKLLEGWTRGAVKAMAANAETQRTAAERTAGTVEKLRETGAAFLRQFEASREEALAESRRDWTRTRRWTVPALAAALLLAAPSFAVVGAVGQSTLGLLAPYDETRGWKQAVWERHGEEVRDCMLMSRRTEEAVRCSLDVDLR